MKGEWKGIAIAMGTGVVLAVLAAWTFVALWGPR